MERGIGVGVGMDLWGAGRAQIGAQISTVCSLRGKAQNLPIRSSMWPHYWRRHLRNVGKAEGRGGTDLQIRARISPLPVAKSPPVGLGATEITDGWHTATVSSVGHLGGDERSYQKAGIARICPSDCETDLQPRALRFPRWRLRMG